MVAIKNVIKAVQELLEYQGKARTLASLRTMNRHFLEDMGYSVAALNKGVSAWPWRKEETTDIDQRSSSVAEINRKPVLDNTDYANDSDRKAAA